MEVSTPKIRKASRHLNRFKQGPLEDDTWKTFSKISFIVLFQKCIFGSLIFIDLILLIFIPFVQVVKNGEDVNEGEAVDLRKLLGKSM
jgi:hypothetical protein